MERNDKAAIEALLKRHGFHFSKSMGQNFLIGGFVDSVAGGGGLITLPAYLMAGIPAHLAMGTNKVVNGTGTALASFKYFRGGKVLLRPAIVSGIGALLGAAIGTKIALLINEDILKIMMLVALPCAAKYFEM